MYATFRSYWLRFPRSAPHVHKKLSKITIISLGFLAREEATLGPARINCLSLVSPSGKIFSLSRSGLYKRHKIIAKINHRAGAADPIEKRVEEEGKKKRPEMSERNLRDEKPIIGRKALCYIVYRVYRSHMACVVAQQTTKFFSQPRRERAGVKREKVVLLLRNARRKYLQLN